ncbi:ATP-binding cassette domain-containing protein [Actinomadura sp. 7K534]|uniref:ABC transporter ATP-binding protein n=1 Tax=Actinomadura sp. 7K534 TaxID=2530366 RepID=UPI0010475CE4|nr:ATP-binding cassette domain-containing protein [Actinomadura sp. 7K534]TDB98842.1 ATP-binding cassette domain-containing protein [Actinomadura sp. 7K534]
MITLTGLTKRYGGTTAVADLSLTIEPGLVTGFLGPNGAGKSTTMRMILGLDEPTAGTALVSGRRYARFRHPLREAGALLDARAVHPGRGGRNHLLAMARSNGLPRRRVDEVLDMVGLSDVAGKRAGTCSLGMGQRLGIAGALLGDPPVLMFDEPVNGLDPDGVRWVRELMRSLAAEGRTVFVSSHLMSEMERTADRLVVIGKGRLIADAPVTEILAGSSRRRVRVRGPRPEALRGLAADLAGLGVTADEVSPGELLLSGTTVESVGEAAHRLGVLLHELSPLEATLEQAYMELTAGSTEFTASTGEAR